MPYLGKALIRRTLLTSIYLVKKSLLIQSNNHCCPSFPMPARKIILLSRTHLLTNKMNNHDRRDRKRSG